MNTHSTGRLDSHSVRVVNERRPGIPVWALLLRASPLIVSFLLFVAAASIDVQRWGSRGVQAILALAAVLGVVGIIVFVPKRKFPR